MGYYKWQLASLDKQLTSYYNVIIALDGLSKHQIYGVQLFLALVKKQLQTNKQIVQNRIYPQVISGKVR